MKRNRYTFGIGTIGRDMLYTLYSMFFIFYLTSIQQVSAMDLGMITTVLIVIRILDAAINPFVGVLVDNTKSRFGKFKPWIAIGAFSSGIVGVLLFMNTGLSGIPFVAVVTLLLVLWSITYSLNDIAYWSMLPNLSKEKTERENIGSKARIFALTGTFIVVAGIVPITEFIGELFGVDSRQSYFIFAILVVAIMWLGQSVTLLGVKEPKEIAQEQPRGSAKEMMREMVQAIFKNDQLLLVSISMALFMIGYITTVSFGIFYFEYVYGDVNMYSIFAIVLGVSQIGALAVFPLISKHLKRKTIYFWATLLVVVGYTIFFFAPTTTMLFISIAGVLIFIGQACIQLLMLLFLADTVEYGHWKLGKRSNSVTFSLQPFIFQIGGAIGSGVVGYTVLLSGVLTLPQGATLMGGGLYIFKTAMFVLPLICILVGFLICHFKYKLDEERYAQIVEELKERTSD